MHQCGMQFSSTPFLAVAEMYLRAALGRRNWSMISADHTHHASQCNMMRKATSVVCMLSFKNGSLYTTCKACRHAGSSPERSQAPGLLVMTFFDLLCRWEDWGYA